MNRFEIYICMYVHVYIYTYVDISLHLYMYTYITCVHTSQFGRCVGGNVIRSSRNIHRRYFCANSRLFSNSRRRNLYTIICIISKNSALIANNKVEKEYSIKKYFIIYELATYIKGEVGGWGRDPKKCTGRDWGMGSSTI